MLEISPDKVCYLVVKARAFDEDLPSLDEDDPEGIPLSRSYLKQKDYTFQVLFDPDGEIQSFYSVEKHPTTIILDADGNIIYKHEGYSKGDEEEFEEIIVDYLIEIGNLEE